MTGPPSPSIPRLLLGNVPYAAEPACSSHTPFDGAWWPRSADPSAEFPGLIRALQGPGPPREHGPVMHILRAADRAATPTVAAPRSRLEIAVTGVETGQYGRGWP
ncbi:DUF5994 family protein [Actinoallomurus liliacearum]|uniref:DUF5994 family protein n=1 Tax=Actinoallomurus liliacearum TaxID=1080073 RepID=UPI003CD077C6